MSLNLPDSLFSFYSTGHNAGLDLINTWLRGAQRVRQHQLDQIGAALSDDEYFGTQSDSVRDASGLPAMQQALVRSQIERSTAYWWGLFNTLRQNQLELAEQIRSVTLQMTESLCQSISEMPAAILPVPMASSLNEVIHAASAGLSNAQEPAQAAMNGITGSHRGRVTPAQGAAALNGA
ncbi:MAG: hypothetical protein ABI040_08905 [Rhodoferax sp.]